MKKENQTIFLLASDLSKYLGCQFLTQLDWASIEGRIKKVYEKDLSREAFQIRGSQHEEAYSDFMEKEGYTKCELGLAETQVSTISAMKKGYDIITQATLSNKNWLGRADILKKVKTPSNLGNWSYEVVETKLSQETQAGTILQLCLYSDLLASIQEVQPELMTVVSPGFTITEYQFQKYSAYFRMLQNSLYKTITEPSINVEQPKGIYPEPVPQCDFCDWWMWCKQKRYDDDDLSIIANITKFQKEELHTLDIKTMTSMAKWEIPTDWQPSKGIRDNYIKTKEQAKIQYESKQEGKVLYKLLPLKEDYGLGELPIPSEGDIFFDIEGDTFVGNQGLEYLLGFSYKNQKGELTYTSLWSKNHEEEKIAFQNFIQFVINRLNKYPNLHIYHYAPYEPGAIKRLMGKHAICSDEVDSLLRMRRFVDLMRVVKRSMIVGIDRYSIKELEPLYEFKRDIPLREASAALHKLEFIYEIGQVEALDKEIARIVEGYNRDDCVSTKKLHNWLEKIHNSLGDKIGRPSLPVEEPLKKDISEKQEHIKNIQKQLMMSLPETKEERSQEQHMIWILSQLLEFYERERKAASWEFFRLTELTDNDLLYEKSGLHNLSYIENVGGTEQNPICRYSFQKQDFDIKIGSEAKQVGGEPYGTFIAIDQIKGFVDIKKKLEKPHTRSVFSFDYIRLEKHQNSIIRFAECVVDHGITSIGKFQATKDLLLKRSPRLNSKTSLKSLQKENKSNVEIAIRIIDQLDSSVLAIQGPPGSGKTYLASQVIISLAKQGKKIGVTALSHKVIQNLLTKVASICYDKNLDIKCAHKVSKKSENYSGHIEEIIDYTQVLKKIEKNKINVIGGTTWMWAREDFYESVDYLFIDEAGQFSLADALVVSQAGKNLVLLGDPRQLERPIQAKHPEDTDISALQHLMGENTLTISEEKGLFLKETWRMHPDICRFISEQFYEKRLKSKINCSNQKIIGSSFLETGLKYIPIKHKGCQTSSPEEVKIISKIYQEFLSNASWVNKDKITTRLTQNDILIITPYNAQVKLLTIALPQARIGTVDKFQGQEAAIVIYSLTASTQEDAPHGMSFLYSQNRLNVAISRAKCVSIMVGNPQIFSANCKSPAQIKLVNSFCRYKELAEHIIVET